MGERLQAYLDDETYDRICDEHKRTGKAKSKILGKYVEKGMQTGDNWFLRSFGQALFVVGFVIAFYQSFPAGLGVSFLGLGLMLWTQMQEHASNPNTSYWDAFKRTLGV